MPLYEYTCDAGHTSEHLFAYEHRPDAVICGCGRAGRRIFSLPAPGKVTGSRNPLRSEAKTRPAINEIGSGLTLIDWKCPDCAKISFEVYENRPETSPICDCGAATREIIGVPDADWFTKACSGNPNGLWSDAAGRYFTSKADRQAWMDEHNLMDGNDVDSEAIRRKGSEKRTANDEYCADMCDEYDHDPVLRQLRDEGRVPGWDHLRPGRDIV